MQWGKKFDTLWGSSFLRRVIAVTAFTFLHLSSLDVKHRSTEHNSSLMMSESELDSEQDNLFNYGKARNRANGALRNGDTLSLCPVEGWVSHGHFIWIFTSKGVVEYSTNTDADKEWAAKLLTTECIWSCNEYSLVCWMILSITNSTFFLDIKRPVHSTHTIKVVLNMLLIMLVCFGDTVQAIDISYFVIYMMHLWYILGRSCK